MTNNAMTATSDGRVKRKRVLGVRSGVSIEHGGIGRIATTATAAIIAVLVTACSTPETTTASDSASPVSVVRTATPPSTQSTDTAAGPIPSPRNGSQPVAPGTNCTETAGGLVVTVVSGRITCDEALAVIKRYRDLPASPSAGTANTRTFDAWTCTTPILAAAQQLHYSASCQNPFDGTHLTTPLSNR
ncbi:hypothetical protein [Nocardia tengchongensis]|uniref:hypothetical protein n=1 Tax=Nocardia tengchongensis TaxID=2055889 RepID=UPI003648B0BA